MASATVTITINGSNGPPPHHPRLAMTGSSLKMQNVNGAGNPRCNGTLSVTDTDAGQAGFRRHHPRRLRRPGSGTLTARAYTAASNNPAIPKRAGAIATR